MAASAAAAATGGMGRSKSGTVGKGGTVGTGVNFGMGSTDGIGGSTLGQSASSPSLGRNKPVMPAGVYPQHRHYLHCDDKTVSFPGLFKFLYPTTLENPNVIGRLELFAKYGPADDEGILRGGVAGTHAHNDSEIGLMITHECREALYKQFKKPRAECEVIVASMMPIALSAFLTEKQVQKLLRHVPRENGRMDFCALSVLVLQNQQDRLRTIVKRIEAGQPINPPKERPVKVPYQSMQARALHELTMKTKFETSQEEVINRQKRQHAYYCLVAPLENNSQGRDVTNNTMVVRHAGDVNDRWDRYCALRRAGRSSYVGARNTERYNPSLDDGIANKHPGCSSLLGACAGGTSAAATLGAS